MQHMKMQLLNNNLVSNDIILYYIFKKVLVVET